MYKQYFRSDYCGNVARPNQSLKLTEPAVSFSPRAKKFLRERRCLPRVLSTIDLAARRRSLAPVR